MSKKNVSALIMVLLVSGCTLSSGHEAGGRAQPSPSPVAAPPAQPGDAKTSPAGPAATGSHLTQCNRDLESLRTVSMTAYRRYQGEYDALMKSSAGFMTVKDDVSPEVAELARPRFQFALVNLCYRIKDALAQTLINQAGGR